MKERKFILPRDQVITLIAAFNLILCGKALDEEMAKYRDRFGQIQHDLIWRIETASKEQLLFPFNHYLIGDLMVALAWVKSNPGKELKENRKEFWHEFLEVYDITKNLYDELQVNVSAIS